LIQKKAGQLPDLLSVSLVVPLKQKEKLLENLTLFMIVQNFMRLILNYTNIVILGIIVK